MQINLKKYFIFFILFFLLINTANLNYVFSQSTDDSGKPLNPPEIPKDEISEVTDELINPPKPQEEDTNNQNKNIPEDPQMKEALYACEKAIKLAQMYGFFVSYSPDFKDIIKKIGLEKELKNQSEELLNSIARELNIDTNKLKNELKEFGNQILNETGISGIIQDSKTFNNALKGITNKFTSFFENTSFAKTTKEKVNSIITDAAKNYLVKNNPIISKTIDTISSGLGGLIGGMLDSKVPTNDEGTQKTIRESISKSTEAIVKSNEQILGELKRQETLRSTREKCFNLLKETVSQIKNSLLFQLSTQIADSMLNGDNIIKDPERLKNLIFNTAVNNFLSNVTPQLCSNFKIEIDGQVAVNLPGFPLITPYPPPKPPFEWKCTLDEVLARAEDLQNFFEDFKNGGMPMFLELLEPQNDPILTSIYLRLALADEYNKQMEDFNSITKNGFIGKKRCEYWAYYRYGGYISSVQHQKILLEQGKKIRNKYYFDQTETIMNADTFEEYKNKSNKLLFVADSSGPPNVKGFVYYVFEKNKPDENPIGMFECISTEITQPPSITENLAQKASVQELDILKEAEDLEQYFYYVRNSIIQKLIKKGYNGLKDLLPKEIIEFTDEIFQ